MRYVVLGGGQQGSACAFDLLRHTDAPVLLVDRPGAPLAAFLAGAAPDRLRLVAADARDPGSIGAHLAPGDVVLNALPYYFNEPMTRLALEVGCHYADLGGHTETVLRQKSWHEEARVRGVSVVPDCGLAPGLVNILAAYGIAQLDRARRVRIYVGGLPQRPEPPLQYQIVYSLEGVLDYYTTPSWVLRDGRPVQVEALSEVESVRFEALGELEAFHTAGGLSTMAQRYAGVVDSMEYKTLRYPGHAAIMRAIRDLGLLDLEPVAVDGHPVVPRRVFVAVVEPRLRKDPRQSPDLVALRVEVEGEQAAEPVRLEWEGIDRYDPTTGITAMMRTTGFSLAITGQMQAEGRLPPGVWTPDEVVPAPEFLAALAARGIRIAGRRVPLAARTGAQA